MKNDVVERVCGQSGGNVQMVELEADHLKVTTGGREQRVPLPAGVGEIAAIGIGPSLVGADGRSHSWSGRGWASTKPVRHVPVVTVRRASHRLDGMIECVVQHPWSGGEYDHGTVVLLDPVEYEARRRAGLVRAVPRSKKTMLAIVLRPWRAGLREGQQLRLPDGEIEQRAKRGECDFLDPQEKPSSATPTTVRVAFFSAVALGGHVDALAGEIHELPYQQALDLEWRGVGTILEEGDEALVDGELVTKVGPGPPPVEQPRSWVAGIFMGR